MKLMYAISASETPYLACTSAFSSTERDAASNEGANHNRKVTEDSEAY